MAEKFRRSGIQDAIVAATHSLCPEIHVGVGRCEQSVAQVLSRRCHAHMGRYVGGQGRERRW